MEERIFKTKSGDIHYYINILDHSRHTLILLPGLTADHRLFDKQVEYFEGKVNILTWDAPGHAASRPFMLDFNLNDKAYWLEQILIDENIELPVIAGQSMGGYVGQMYQHLFPDRLKAFISIDSAPLQRKYMAGWEIWSLKHTEMMYKLYPWKWLLRDGSKGNAVTEYGILLMREMMEQYGRIEYSKLTGHGFRILSEAVEADLPYEIKCPAMLVCGKQDRAGFTKRYNERWHKVSGITISWIDGAGHNSNTDKPEEVNMIIEDMLNCLICRK